MKQLTEVAIALGGNVGDRLGFLRRAAARLQEDVFEPGARFSSVYETPPWGIVDQAPFLNAVVAGWTEWKPAALLSYLKQLETELGRTPGPRNGPREIDLDLLIHGNAVLEGDGLTVPHPRLWDRDFVLVPLRQVWPHWRHPLKGQSVGEVAPSESPFKVAGHL